MKLKFDKAYDKIIRLQDAYIKSFKNRKYISESIVTGILGNVLSGNILGNVIGTMKDLISVPFSTLTGIMKSFTGLEDDQKKKVELALKKELSDKKSEKIGEKCDNIPDDKLLACGNFLEKTFPDLTDLIKNASKGVLRSSVLTFASMVKSFGGGGVASEQVSYKKSLRGKTYISESILGNIFSGLTGGVLGGLVNGIGGTVSNVLNIPGNAVGGLLKTFNGLTGNLKQGMQQMVQQALENQKATAQVGAKADNVSNILADKKWLMNMFPDLAGKIKDAPPDVVKGLMISAAAVLKRNMEKRKGGSDNKDDGDNENNDDENTNKNKKSAEDIENIDDIEEEDFYDEEFMQDIIQDIIDDITEAKQLKDRKSYRIALRKLRTVRNKLKRLFGKTKNRKRKRRLQVSIKYLQSAYTKSKSGAGSSSKDNGKQASQDDGKQVSQDDGKQASKDNGKQASQDNGKQASAKKVSTQSFKVNKFSKCLDVLAKLKRLKGIELTLDDLKKYNPQLKDKKDVDQVGVLLIRVPIG